MATREKGSNSTKKHILNEGELRKKGGIFKRWRPRFVVLNEETLSIFNRKDDESKGRAAKHSLPVTDISSIENHDSKKKSHCFRFNVDNRSYIFCCPTELARDLWIRMIREAKERQKEPKEETATTSSSNPTVTSKQLNPGLKEIRIERQKGQGLGCTIKSVGGVISVNRILEDGPVSTTGVLRPGDEIIEVNGIKVSGFSPAEISEIIKGSPEIVVCTVRPYDSVTFADRKKNLNYTEIDPDKTAKLHAGINIEVKDQKSSTTETKDYGPPPERPPRADRSNTYTDVHFSQAQESPEPTSRIKHSYAYEYEDDMITAASRRNNSVSEKDIESARPGNGSNAAGVSVTLPRSLSRRENGPEYENVFIGASGRRNSLPLIRKVSGDDTGLNYADLDFSEVIENEEHMFVKEKLTHKRSNSLPAKSTWPSELESSRLNHQPEGENVVKPCDSKGDETEAKSDGIKDCQNNATLPVAEKVYPRVKYPYAELDFSKKEDGLDEQIHNTETQGLLT